MGVREAQISAPKSSLLDLCNDVQAIENRRRRLGVLGVRSLPIAGLRP